ncbi:MAG: hypothetical protein Ct9H90mP22_8960 [Gammaproteobacteria bacterium]|nr:MAG: hypothetical protein Ct9H90mP22_8960 [Gammaproteobacteria bacterium]
MGISFQNLLCLTGKMPWIGMVVIKPDLRIPLELIEISDLVKDEEFKVFSDQPKKNSRVVALKVPKRETRCQGSN